VCQSAFDAGLAAVGFSSHAPPGAALGETDWHMKAGMLRPYIDEVRACGLRWQGRLPVYLGLEVDYVRGMRSAVDPDILAAGLDYVIGSVHYVVPPGAGPSGAFTVDEPQDSMEKKLWEGFGGDGAAMMHAYWDAVVEMVNLGGFDILGHLDLVRKHNGRDRWFDAEGKEYLGRAEEAVRAASRAGIVAEISTGGMNRGFLVEPLPSAPILRLMKRYGVPVTVTADAHRRDDVAGHYRQAAEFLAYAGYACHAVFEGRSAAGSPIWRERPL